MGLESTSENSGADAIRFPEGSTTQCVRVSGDRIHQFGARRNLKTVDTWALWTLGTTSGRQRLRVGTVQLT